VLFSLADNQVHFDFNLCVEKRLQIY